MIYSLLSQNFVVRIHALFPQDFFGMKSKIRRHFYFLDVWSEGEVPIISNQLTNSHPTYIVMSLLLYWPH